MDLDDQHPFIAHRYDRPPGPFPDGLREAAHGSALGRLELRRGGTPGICVPAPAAT